MKKSFRKFIAVSKGIILWLRPHILFGFLKNPLLFSANLLMLTKWIAAQEKNDFYSDFFNFSRDHSNRYKLYRHVIEKEGLNNIPLEYLEFGVSQGHSIRWWISANQHPESRFYGFDTFEGLPEDWGTYNKGEMSAGIPDLSDERVAFIKGLFQDTLVDFIKKYNPEGKRKIIHLDADLFSATLFVLTTLARELKPGDILLFDEFNVPNHEWMAYKQFVDSFYMKTEVLGAVNNYYQVAFKIID